MERPSIAALDAPRRSTVQDVARRLASAGHRAWMVGGAVRDLALGRAVADIDLASAARPEDLEALFARTHAVGRAFGTVILVEGGMEMEVTTFRADGAYGDSRRPDEVVFGTELAADAERRDFTCNAVYLDPLTDELADPTGGLADLERRTLRCVGDADRRFREDGLRLLRLARFAAVYGLAVEDATWRAAGRALDALAGVSAERIFAELERVVLQGAAPAALRLLAASGALLRAVPGLAGLHPPELSDGEALEQKLGALERFGGRPDLVAVLALLLDPLDAAREEEAVEVLVRLRPPRAIVDGVRALWRMASDLSGSRSGAEGWRRRATGIRLIRAPEWESFVALGRAWGGGAGGEPLTELVALAALLGEEELRPAPFVTSADLAAAGIPRGPRWGELLHRAEDLQLGGAHRSRAEALRWLAQEAAKAK
ncbi:MAG: CCA tRNA nucleotidyltransferase [Planctomycetota bacterium]